MTTKTTVYLDSEDYRRLKSIARAQGRTPGALVRDAVAEYARRHGKRRTPPSVGAACSGRATSASGQTNSEEGMARTS